jgi:hypothetical protein
MDKMLRESWNYEGTPIQLWFIDRDEEKEKKFKNNGNRDRTMRRNKSEIRFLLNSSYKWLFRRHTPDYLFPTGEKDSKNPAPD